MPRSLKRTRVSNDVPETLPAVVPKDLASTKSTDIMPEKPTSPPDMPEEPAAPEEVTKHTDNVIQADPPVHLFAKVPETMYVPPHKHNFGTLAGKSSREKEPAYHTQAPIQNSALANNVYKHSMKTPCVTLT